MNILNNQWLSGLAFLIAGLILEQLFLSRSLISSTQYIDMWPQSLGGNDTLNLDNTVSLKATVPYSEMNITMLAGVVPIGEKNINNPNFKAENINVIFSNSNQKYTFDVLNNKTNKISYNGRSFFVTLNKVRKISIQGVSLALKYEFIITEMSLFDKIKNLF